jgi:hypothetical protein
LIAAVGVFPVTPAAKAAVAPGKPAAESKIVRQSEGLGEITGFCLREQKNYLVFLSCGSISCDKIPAGT